MIVRDGQVLLARRAKEPYAGWWEVPGGFVELGEHPSETAAFMVTRLLAYCLEYAEGIAFSEGDSVPSGGRAQIDCVAIASDGTPSDPSM